MKILSVNAGSATLKFTLFEMPEEKELITGNFEKIGLDDSFYSIKLNGEKITRDTRVNTHEDAVKYLIQELLDSKLISSLDDINGVGHRIVNGGADYIKTTLIDEEFLTNFNNLLELAPLHNPNNLGGILAFRKALPNTKMTAVFDTAYHQTMSKEEFLYPVPYEWYTKHKVRKYGAHGTSHRYINKRISEELGRSDLKVISCHLGSGASICAIDSDKVVDTSMGFTPLAGIMMNTRSGDIDPSIIPYIMEKEGMTAAEVINVLNKKSGNLGICGLIDSRDIEEECEKGNEMCILATKIGAKKIANYIAMYNNLLGGADVITFTAGQGERSIDTRINVVEAIKSLGAKIDLERNNVKAKFTKISSDDSKILLYVVPTNEELMIAIDTYELVK